MTNIIIKLLMNSINRFSNSMMLNYLKELIKSSDFLKRLFPGALNKTFIISIKND